MNSIKITFNEGERIAQLFVHLGELMSEVEFKVEENRLFLVFLGKEKEYLVRCELYRSDSITWTAKNIDSFILDLYYLRSIIRGIINEPDPLKIDRIKINVTKDDDPCFNLFNIEYIIYTSDPDMVFNFKEKTSLKIKDGSYLFREGLKFSGQKEFILHQTREFYHAVKMAGFVNNIIKLMVHKSAIIDTSSLFTISAELESNKYFNQLTIEHDINDCDQESISAVYLIDPIKWFLDPSVVWGSTHLLFNHNKPLTLECVISVADITLPLYKLSLHIAPKIYGDEYDDDN